MTNKIKVLKNNYCKLIFGTVNACKYMLKENFGVKK